MNKKELEKMFDEEVKSITMDYDDNWNPLLYNPNNTLKEFIFKTITPEVLKSIIDRPFLSEADDLYREWYDDCISNIKQKAKELYWIDL